MSATRAYLRALVLARSHIDEVLTLANQALTADMAGNHFVTLLYARLDRTSRSLHYASAGHPDGYVVSSQGEVRTVLESTSMPLGVVSDTTFPVENEVPLQSGDTIFLFTDGLVDAMAPDGTFFGTDRALEIIRGNQSQPAAAIVESLHEAVENFVQTPHLTDDVTVINIKVL